LTFNIGFDHFQGCSAGGQQAEALTPECFLPQPAFDFRMFFLDQTAASTLIGVDKSADLAFGVGFEKDMNVILIVIVIVIPFLKRNLVIRCNILENFSGSGRNRFIQHLSSVFHNQNKVIMEKKYRMCIIV